ncbi:MAG: N-acetylmuramoyl-L-alanine amidase [Magnetococcales bacterium]|nr:N-acetylmuramoyl-L-alanine amidase [Magnetococcales bacterium]MBF0439350.1 N-acetylmuramoyl-L-alanine amidase [Magnetococcales bacterium]
MFDRRSMIKAMAVTAGGLFLPSAVAEAATESFSRVSKRGVVIAIDPGHGGADPGAVGKSGVREKDITLAVARRVANEINAMPGFTAQLTRTGDYYVSLKQRVSTARKHQADLFISLHADAFHINSARGASVYCLSERGKPSPDKAIRLLETRENNADLIGGVDLDEVADREVKGILMDLSQRDSLNRSLLLGTNLLSAISNTPPLALHFRTIKQASFAVLKAPDMPSVLVEMAFLSNQQEEMLLQQGHHQESLAKAVTQGARRFARSSGLA